MRKILMVMLAVAGMASCGKKAGTPPAVADAGTISGPNLLAEGGEPVELSIEAIAGADTYKWYRDGMEEQNTASRTLSVSKAGIYRVAGVNAGGEGKSSHDHVVALYTPDPTVPPAAAGTISGPTELGDSSVELTIAVIKDAATYKWYRNGVPVQNTASRKLTVAEAGTYRVAGVNAVGEGAASPDHIVAAKPEIPFIDRLTGAWDVTEFWVENGEAYINDHVVTITKVDDTTIEIANFNGAFPDPDDARDKVRAVIDNTAKTMTIPTSYEIVPSWNADYGKTHVMPVIHVLLSDNWGLPFPAQQFAEDGETMKMEMRAGDLTVSMGGVPYYTTYAIVAASNGGTFAGEYGYCVGTTWTKQGTGQGLASGGNASGLPRRRFK